MTTPEPPGSASAAAGRASSGAPESPGHRTAFGRLRKATDRVPTKWFAAIGTGLFLAVTAAFGGLAPVAAEEEPPLDRLVAGETHTGEQLAITVQRAVLIDELPGSGAFPDEENGERLLVLLVEMENLWTEPLPASTASLTSQVAKSVGLSGDDRLVVGLVREDDQTFNPWLQPDVPALLAFTWTVGPDDYAGDQDLEVVLSDARLQIGSFLYTGESWLTPVPAAVVTVPIEDVGAGVEQ